MQVEENEEKALSRRERRRSRRRARSRRQRWTRRVIGGVVALVVVALAVAGGGWWYLNYRLDQTKRVHVAHLVRVVKPGAPFNVLLIGSDSRQFEKTKNQASAFGQSSVVTGQRSDVIIIARVVPKTRHIYLLSIPRDTYVTIPGHIEYVSGQNRINAAFNSGPSLLIETVEKDFGIPIEHFAEVNFAGFQSMVQAVGGIRIDFPDRVKDAYSGLNIRRTGCQLISGGMSLAYVRSRHLYYEHDGVWNYDGMSDWSRIRRQDVFFHALLKQVKSKDLNIPDMNSLLISVVHNLTLDDRFTNSELLNLALEFRTITGKDISSEVLPTEGYITSGGADVLLPAEPYDTRMIRGFLLEGTRTAPPAKKSPSSTSSTSSTTTTTTTTPAEVVFDKQPEPWNGTPC